MIEFVYECVVNEEARGLFELAYGPGGAWSALFGDSPGFRGTTLLRDAEQPRRYLAIEIWDTAADREEALAEGAAEYAALGATLAEWTESRRELGIFRVLAEGTVRPRGRPGGSGRRRR
jgi:heme-degrading monooxygenase HmoA